MLPASALSFCDDIDAAYLRVLLWLASDLTLSQKPKQLSKLAGCDAKTLRAAMEYWSQKGVLVGDGESAVPVMAAAEPEALEQKAKKEPEKHLHRADELPNYTSTQLAELMEQREGVRVLVDEAQHAEAVYYNSELYKKELIEFLTKYMK